MDRVMDLARMLACVVSAPNGKTRGGGGRRLHHDRKQEDDQEEPSDHFPGDGQAHPGLRRGTRSVNL